MITAVVSLSLLAASLLSFWFKFSRFFLISGVLLLAGTGLAIYEGNISTIGASALLVFALFLYLEKKLTSSIIKRLLSWVVGIMAFAFFTHFIPGFHNYLWLSQAKLSALSASFNVYWNFDKTIATGIIGLCLFYGSKKISPNLFQKNTLKSILSTGLVASILSVSLLMGLGLALNYVVLDIKFPALFWPWFLSNLIFVCIAEEIVFRGYIQSKLTHYFTSRKKSWVWGLIIASVIFGLLHFRGGPVYIALAAVAGLFYGYAYYKTKRIETSIFVHLALNTVHFIFFSYPYSVKMMA